MEIYSLEKDDILYDANQKKLKLMKSEMSRDDFVEVMGSYVNRKERGRAKVVDGSIMIFS